LKGLFLAVIPGRRASIAAVLVVTAETVLMAVILIVEDDVYPRRRGDACYTTSNTINDKTKAVFVEGTHFLQKLYTKH
jgi:hypothetical protein